MNGWAFPHGDGGFNGILTDLTLRAAMHPQRCCAACTARRPGRAWRWMVAFLLG